MISNVYNAREASVTQSAIHIPWEGNDRQHRERNGNICVHNDKPLLYSHQVMILLFLIK